MGYLEKIHAAQQKNNSWLCVALEPDPARLPLPAMQWDEPVLPFNKAIVDATAELVCAYKPTLGFYLQWGAAGVVALERTIAYIPDHIPIILDARVGESGRAQAAWGTGAFDHWQVDALTVAPAAGKEALLPLVGDHAERAAYLPLYTPEGPGEQAEAERLGEAIAASQRWTLAGHLGYVIGVTAADQTAAARRLARARREAPAATFLIPDVGVQGGGLAVAVAFGPAAAARGATPVGPLISAGRRVLYAGVGIDFVDRVREAAAALRERINSARGA